jgi:hypothetical protein
MGNVSLVGELAPPLSQTYFVFGREAHLKGRKDGRVQEQELDLHSHSIATDRGSEMGFLTLV